MRQPSKGSTSFAPYASPYCCFLLSLSLSRPRTFSSFLLPLSFEYIRDSRKARESPPPSPRVLLSRRIRFLGLFTVDRLVALVSINPPLLPRIPSSLLRIYATPRYSSTISLLGGRGRESFLFFHAVARSFRTNRCHRLRQLYRPLETRRSIILLRLGTAYRAPLLPEPLAIAIHSDRLFAPFVAFFFLLFSSPSHFRD